MIQELLLIILLSLIPCCFNYFLNYCLGEPMSKEPKDKAILSHYSLWIAKNRLKKMKQLEPIHQQFIDMYEKGETPQQILDTEAQENLTILLTAQKYYTWEQAFGMCPYCTNFWFSQLAALMIYLTVSFNFIDSLLLFLLVPIFSHSVLRKL